VDNFFKINFFFKKTKNKLKIKLKKIEKTRSWHVACTI